MSAGDWLSAAQFDPHSLSQQDYADLHWEDRETPDCHYCGETAHTTAEHELEHGWGFDWDVERKPRRNR